LDTNEDEEVSMAKNENVFLQETSAHGATRDRFGTRTRKLM